MGWKLFQGAIVLSVMFANIPLGMTDNHLAAAVMGITLAAVVTAFTMKIEELWRRRRSRQERLGESSASAGSLRGDLLDAPQTFRPGQKHLR
jgi:hypothetical protein